MGFHAVCWRPSRGRQVRIAIVPGFREVCRNGLSKPGGVIEIRSLDEERKGAESIGLVGVADSVGLGQDDDGQALEVGLGLDPAKDFEAVSAGQSEVQKKKVGKRKLRAICEAPESGEVRDGVLAVAHGDYRRKNPGFAESAFDEDNVILVVLCQQNGRLVSHCSTLLGVITDVKWGVGPKATAERFATFLWIFVLNRREGCCTRESGASVAGRSGPYSGQASCKRRWHRVHGPSPCRTSGSSDSERRPSAC